MENFKGLSIIQKASFKALDLAFGTKLSRFLLEENEDQMQTELMELETSFLNMSDVDQKIALKIISENPNISISTKWKRG